MEVLIDRYVDNDDFKVAVSNKNFLFRIPKRTNTSIVISNKTKTGVNGRIMSLLDSYRKLADDWDKDGALAPKDIVISNSYNIVRLLQAIGQKIYHSAPGPYGEIMLDVRDDYNKKSFEIIIYDDKANIVFIPREGIPIQEDFKNSNLKEYLNWLNRTDDE